MPSMERGEFEILAVHGAETIDPEPMGSKWKRWFRSADGRRGLFKENRPGSGEDWAEKVAAHLAALLGVPHADCDLAELDGRRGVVSWSFLREDEHTGRAIDELRHGNEILAMTVPGYPRLDRATGKHLVIAQHTVPTVLEVCSGVACPPGWPQFAGIIDGADVMVGYLLLDAWIGNTDRHDQNWGWIESPGGKRFLASSFDHASSLGRNEPDASRERRLTTKADQDTVEAYARRARSSFYRAENTMSPLLTTEALRQAMSLRPAAARVWRDRLASVPMNEVQDVLDRVPVSRISRPASLFASRMLDCLREVVLALPLEDPAT